MFDVVLFDNDGVLVDIAAKAAGLACWVVPSPLTAAGCFDDADAVLLDLAAVATRLTARD